MNPRVLEFALRKQRLQIRAEGQRADMLRRIEGIEPALDVVDSVRETLRWAREQAPALSSVVLLGVLWKPRLALRLARRVVLGWAFYRRVAWAGPLRIALGLLVRRLRGGSAARG